MFGGNVTLEESTSEMITIFSRDLRVEHQVGNLLFLALLFCIAQLGGIPTPKKDSGVALGLWYIW